MLNPRPPRIGIGNVTLWGPEVKSDETNVEVKVKHKVNAMREHAPVEVKREDIKMNDVHDIEGERIIKPCHIRKVN